MLYCHNEFKVKNRTKTSKNQLCFVVKGMFNCDKCGLCCMNVGESLIYEELNRGDGVCRFFDDVSKLCTIYEKRPVLCNVDEAYDHFFSTIMSKKEYYRMNYEACRRLKSHI